MVKTSLQLSITWGACFLLAGCESLAYYQQAAAGQWQLLARQQSLDDVLTDPNTSTSLRGRLASVQALRRFAQQRLALPVGSHYTRYADLGRSHVVWNVVAAPEFSLRASSWCYPIAGCVHYRGYFRQGAALRKAAQLRGEGADVYVGGVAAYSTLGWLSDPVLNTFVQRRDSGLSMLLFHELAHQRVYVPGDTSFNESFAEAVAIEGTRAWLEATGDDRQSIRFEREQAEQVAFMQRVHDLRGTLDRLYASGMPPAQMRIAKQRCIAEWRRDYLIWRRRNPAASAYDGFVFGELNNAKLAAVADYSQWVGAFRQLWREQGGDWPRFYTEVERLGRQDQARRHQLLVELGLRADIAMGSQQAPVKGRASNGL